ncbi:MAG: hypothetical protein LBL19_07975 [Spirochaetaceae bacterium]|jgi:hypothetical protein|nr:hypothetical protein [Spirochaetaceae bacterium]
MNKRINLQDNIFALNGRLRITRELLVLDVDPALFFERAVDDISFIDHALEVLLEDLRENDRHFERDEALDYLSDLEWDFSQFLGEFSGNSGAMTAEAFPAIQEQFRLLRNRSTERRKLIDEKRSSAASPVIENAVSSDELNELLKGF